uniref:Uncharacterized protein n=1 Tax=Nelumbo nucifera TaxID=4432 RepID=A0A822YRB3_NELNU|nr:TPA_asm: hypothetical protein HUJ06_005323 [Nelumbo nucifera]
METILWSHTYHYATNPCPLQQKSKCAQVQWNRHPEAACEISPMLFDQITKPIR